MATTTYGSPYVQSSDLVSGWPTASQNVADRIDDVAMKGNGINAQTGTTYTLVLTDAGKNITRSNGSASTLDIPTNASVAFEVGTVVAVTNLGAGAVTVQGSGVTINGPSLVLAQWESARLMKLATDTWVVVKGGGLPKAAVSGTTGSPSVDSSTRPGKTIYRWTGDGSITVSTAGVAEVLIAAAGGGGGRGNATSTNINGGGGGGGGVYESTTFYLPAGTHTITIGAGGAAHVNGGNTTLGSLVGAPGGGGGGGDISSGQANKGGSNGGSGGGGQCSNNATYYSGGLGLTGQGNTGGNGHTAGTALGNGGGGGGGASAAGSNGTASVGGNGGAGVASSITGSSVTRGGGGGGARNSGSPGSGGSGGGGAGGTTTGTNGTANTGGGGGGGGGNNTAGTGGSGETIIVIG